jgi:plasmid stabilization system protein ParE
MKLRFTIRAVQDLADLADYIQARNPKAAQHVRAAGFSQ